MTETAWKVVRVSPLQKFPIPCFPLNIIVLTTKASKPADAKTCSSVILYKAGIHPRKLSGRIGSAISGFVCRFLAAYNDFQRGRRICVRGNVSCGLCQRMMENLHRKQQKQKCPGKRIEPAAPRYLCFLERGRFRLYSNQAHRRRCAL